MAEANAQTYKTGNEVRPRAQAQELEGATKDVGQEIDREVGRLQKKRGERTRAKVRNKPELNNEETHPEKLSGFGFTMILGVAIIKDVWDVTSGIIGGVILSFGSSIVAGFALFQYFDSSWFAAATTGVVLQALKFTGVGTAAISAVNMGLFFAFVLGAIIFSLFLQFIVFTYLAFQGVFGVERGLARKLLVTSGAFIISMLPMINWIPETTGTLLILRHFDKGYREKEGGEKSISTKPTPRQQTPEVLLA